MTYRPYPNVDRALAQLNRGRRPEPVSEFRLRLAVQADAALEAAGRVMEPFARGLRQNVARLAPPREYEPGEYRLSTR